MASQGPSIEQFKYSKRVVLKSIVGREDGGLGLAGERVVVGGWVKSKKEKKGNGSVGSSRPAAEAAARDLSCCEVLLSRIPLLRSIARVLVGRNEGLVGRDDSMGDKDKASVVFLRINDGSCVANLQIIVDSSMSLLGQVMSAGTSILVEGVLEQSQARAKHSVELKVEKILHVGIADVKNYPLAKKRLTLESLRAYPHLRARTTTVASISRIRNALSYATHTFFQKNGFLYVHMPIITTTGMRASGKMFRVTIPKSDDMGKVRARNEREFVGLEVMKAAIKEKNNRVEELKRSDSNKEALLAAVRDLQKANELILQLEEKQKKTSPEIGELDSSRDFFSCQAYLSISAGLHLESYACALSSVYTFGPIFQAEDSHSKKQLAEMWMVEVELAFAELEDVMNCAEDFLKSLCQSILKDCSDDMKFISKRMDNNCIDRLQSIGSERLVRITYTEALEVLKKVTDETFERKPEWGIALSEQHESYLVEKVYKRPIIIYEYPKETKPFYVQVRDDGRTVSAFDIIAPKAGALIRGSQREERIDKISARIEELGLPRNQYEWYLDLRRHGTVKHSGFSLGFENMVMFATGLDDMKDVVAFPRTYGSAHA